MLYVCNLHIVYKLYIFCTRAKESGSNRLLKHVVVDGLLRRDASWSEVYPDERQLTERGGATTKGRHPLPVPRTPFYYNPMPRRMPAVHRNSISGFGNHWRIRGRRPHRRIGSCSSAAVKRLIGLFVLSDGVCRNPTLRNAWSRGRARPRHKPSRDRSFPDIP